MTLRYIPDYPTPWTAPPVVGSQYGGSACLLMEADDDGWWPIPGTPGPAGAAGLTGAPGQDGEDASDYALWPPMRALTGDVTGGAHTGATVIAAEAVTYAKMQKITAGSIVGLRSPSVDAVPESLGAGAGLEVATTTLGIAARGVTAAKLFAAAAQGSFLGRASASGGDFEDVPRFGTAFPGSPFEGQPFYRTDHEQDYFYDSSRSKWLGINLIAIYGQSAATLVANAYLDIVTGVLTMTAALGHPIPFEGTVVGMKATKGDTAGQSTIRLRRNGTNIAGVQFAAATDQHVQSWTLNADFAVEAVVNDSLELFDTIGAIYNAAGVDAVFYVRRHAT